MFLTKKNARYLNKPAKGKEIKTRVLPGWADNQEDEEQTYTYTQKPHEQAEDNNLLSENYKEPKKGESNKKSYFTWDQLNQMNTIECQKKLVESMVEPGGIRVKPNDNMLSQFLKECKGMQPAIIGSLLMSKIQANYSFHMKGKSLYTIQYLVKKNSTYAHYFKNQTDRIKNFEEPEDNVENYKKILKTVLNTIGVELDCEQNKKQDNVIRFQDPGYNNDAQQSKKTNSKKFISPNDSKKVIKGPESKKKQNQFDIFNNDGPVAQNNVTGLENMLSFNDDRQKNNNLTFDELLGQQKKQSNGAGFDFTF